MKVALCLVLSLVAGINAGVVPLAPAVPLAPHLVRVPHLDSAVIQSDRLGGNFAYSSKEAHAYAAVSPVVQNVVSPVGVSYQAHQVATGPAVPVAYAHQPVAYAHQPIAYAHQPIAYAPQPIAYAPQAVVAPQQIAVTHHQIAPQAIGIAHAPIQPITIGHPGLTLVGQVPVEATPVEAAPALAPETVDAPVEAPVEAPVAEDVASDDTVAIDSA